MTNGTVGRGWSLVWRHSRILGWLFAMNLLLGWLSTITPRLELGKILDQSLNSSRLTNGFDLAAFSEILMKPEINFGALMRGSLAYSYAFFLFVLFVTGGILTAYREDRPLPTGEFFEASGAYFWRMVRIFLLSLIPIAAVGVVTAILFGLAGKISNEQTAYRVHLVEIAIIVTLVLLVRLWFDVAQVRAVAQNEHGMFNNVMRALVISLKALGTLFWIYLRISIVAWVILAIGLWLWTKLPGTQTGGSWLLLELVMLTQLFARLWQRAASVTWYGLYAAEHPAAAVEYTTPQPAEITEPAPPGPDVTPQPS